MDTHLSGSHELLEVINEHLAVHIYGEDIDALRENKQLNLGVCAAVKVSPNTEKTTLRTITNQGDLVGNQGTQMMPVFFENGTYELVIESVNLNTNLNIVQNGISLNKYFKQINNITLGSLKFKADVGYTNLDIYVDHKKALSLLIEVFPSKMDYLKDYREMIAAINEEIVYGTLKVPHKSWNIN